MSSITLSLHDCVFKEVLWWYMTADTSWSVICESYQLSLNNYGFPFINLNPCPMELHSSFEQINAIINCLFWLVKVQIIQGSVSASSKIHGRKISNKTESWIQSCVIQFHHTPYLLSDYRSQWWMFYLFIY